MSDKKPAKLCKVCGKPAVDAFDPFCSARCAQVDLNRWLGEAYAIPAENQQPYNPEDDC